MYHVLDLFSNNLTSSGNHSTIILYTLDIKFLGEDLIWSHPIPVYDKMKDMLSV